MKCVSFPALRQECIHSPWTIGLLQNLRRLIFLIRFLVRLSRCKLRATRFSGQIPGTDIPLNVLLIGMKSSVLETFFGGNAEVHDLGIVHPFKQNAAKARLIEPHTDIVITAHYPWSHTYPGTGFIMPAHLDCMLVLPDTPEEFMEHLRPDVRRKVRQSLKAGLQVSLGQTYEDYRQFYDDMVIPLMRYRHGERAVMAPFDEVYGIASRASLLFVTLGGRRVGGVHIRWPSLSRFRYFACFDEVGMADDVSRDPVLFRQINIAIYYFMCVECIKRGVKNLALGDGLPKTNSGLLRFKASWGADCVPNKDFYRFRVDILTEKKHSLLKACHLIRVENEQLVAMVGVDDSGSIVEDEENKAFHGTYRKFDNFEYLYPDGRTQKAAYFGT